MVLFKLLKKLFTEGNDFFNYIYEVNKKFGIRLLLIIRRYIYFQIIVSGIKKIMNYISV